MGWMNNPIYRRITWNQYGIHWIKSNFLVRSMIIWFATQIMVDRKHFFKSRATIKLTPSDKMVLHYQPQFSIFTFNTFFIMISLILNYESNLCFYSKSHCEKTLCLKHWYDDFYNIGILWRDLIQKDFDKILEICIYFIELFQESNSEMTFFFNRFFLFFDPNHIWFFVQ
jgi:hypothetical protein